MVESSKQKEEKKDAALVKDKEQGVQEVEMTQNKHTRNVISPFINQSKTWEDEDLNIPEDLKDNIKKVLGFSMPSKIQAVAIPLIIGEVDKNICDLIAQSKNGSGKTGAFSIGTTLRVDRKILKPQVLVLAHERMISAQYADVYTQLCKYTEPPIHVSNYTVTYKSQGCHIVVSTIGTVQKEMNKRKVELDLSELKCVVIDEADFFFAKKEEIEAIQEFDKKYI